MDLTPNMSQIGPELYWINEIDSTQNAVSGWLADGPLPTGMGLATGFQSAGKGRQGRSWGAQPNESVALSTVINPVGLGLENLGWLTLAAAEGIATGIRSHKIAADIKWPNDILGPDGRKLVGILASYDAHSGCVVMGTGINLAFSSGQRPTPQAAALADYQPELSQLSPQALASQARDWVVQGCSSFIERFARDPSAAIAPIAEKMVTLGQQVRVQLPAGQQLTGQALELADSGALIVEAGGRREEISAGDIVHLRSVLKSEQ